MTSFHDDFQPSGDSSTKRGIIILVAIIIVLGGFFIWYQNRFSSSRIAQQGNNKEGNGLLDGFLNSDNSSVGNDQDYDGLTAQEEEANQTNNGQIDSDNDGLTDGEEVKTYGTNPRQADSDSDGSNDGEEIQNRFNPLDASPTAVWPPVPNSLSTN